MPQLRRGIARFRVATLCRLPAWAVLLLPVHHALAQETNAAKPPPPDPAVFAKRAEKAFTEAKAHYETDTNNADAAWQFGRAVYDWADYATTSAKKAEIAQLGIAACQKLIEKKPDSAPGHYYLSMDLGQLADARRGFAGLKLVGQMESEFKTVLGLDPKIDFAGPDRNLGLLYSQTPGWPISLGSKTKARQNFQQALKLAPDYPENHINLIEAQFKWGEKDDALLGLKALDELLPEARKKFVGDEWASGWADWDRRHDDLEKKAATLKPSGTGRKKP